MKRTPLKRKTTLRRTPSQKPHKPRRGTKRGLKVSLTTSDLKKEIQRLLREIVIIRDGGCFLRHYRDRINPQYLNCGPLKKNGELILQAEHLHSRTHAISFADHRLVVCCCQRHHFYYKPQHSAEYNELAREFIGKKRAELWDFVKDYHRPHKADWGLEIVALREELRLQKKQLV